MTFALCFLWTVGLGYNSRRVTLATSIELDEFRALHQHRQLDHSIGLRLREYAGGIGATPAEAHRIPLRRRRPAMLRAVAVSTGTAVIGSWGAPTNYCVDSAFGGAGLHMHRHTAARERIHQYVLKVLAPRGTVHVHDDESLLEHGVTDSLGIFQLVAFLEQEFQIAIDDEDFLQTNFESIAAVLRYLQEKHGLEDAPS